MGGAQQGHAEWGVVALIQNKEVPITTRCADVAAAWTGLLANKMDFSALFKAKSGGKTKQIAPPAKPKAAMPPPAPQNGGIKKRNKKKKRKHAAQQHGGGAEKAAGRRRALERRRGRFCAVR